MQYSTMIPGWPASRKLDYDTRLAFEPETGLLFIMLPGWPASRKLDYDTRLACEPETGPLPPMIPRGL